MSFALTSSYYTVWTLAVSHMRRLNKNCAIRKTLTQCFKNKQITSAACPDTIIAPHTQCNALEQTAFSYTNESMQFGADLQSSEKGALPSCTNDATVGHNLIRKTTFNRTYGTREVEPSMTSLQTHNQSHWSVVRPTFQQSKYPLLGSGNHNLVWHCLLFFSHWWE